MKLRKINLAVLLPMGLLSVILASMAIISCNDSVGQTTENEKAEESEEKKLKVLYVTFEPGRFHDYKAQKNEFMTVADKNKWETTILTGSHDEVVEKLATDPNFADGQDVVVYNFCFAHTSNLNVPYNIIETTKRKGIPAMLIHCALHSFWPTYKENGEDSVHAPGAHEKARTTKELLAQWQKDHPDKEFPSWPKFTGISSTGHGPQTPIKTINLQPKHGSLKDVPEYETVKAELYNNFINAKDSKESIPLIEGKQGKKSSIVMWEHPVGKSKVVSLTLGHSTEEWQQAEFLQIIDSTVKYLGKHRRAQKK